MRFAPVAFAVLFAVSAHAEPLPLRGPILPLTKLGLFQIYVMPPGGIADAASLSANQSFTGVNTFSQDAASTNTVLYPAICQRTSSGTPAASIGCGISFVVENGSNVNKTIGLIEATMTTVTNGAEQSRLDFKRMSGGAAASLGLSLISNGIVALPIGHYLQWSAASLLYSDVDGVIYAKKNGGSVNSWIQAEGRERVTSDITNATTTFANITGLTANVISARKYAGRIVLRVDNSLAADGIKLDFNGGGATMTSFWAACHIDVGGAAVAVTQISTSLAGVINWSTITGDNYISCDVSFVPSSTSTFIMRQAGNSAASGTLTTRVGTYWNLQDIP